MNQEKIGKFIAKNRKEKGLTQEKFAEMLGTTSKSISRWENGKTMPDVSLFKQICEVLDITMNELLTGEKIEKNSLNITTDNFIKYTKYLNKNEKIKMKRSFLVSIILLFLMFIISILIFNKTFLKNSYNLDFLENASIPIPRFSYYRETRGMEEYTTKLKTLKQPDKVNILINEYLKKLEKINCNNNTYYYNKNGNFTIIQYKINNDGIGFVNTIYIQYSDGNICK